MVAFMNRRPDGGAMDTRVPALLVATLLLAGCVSKAPAADAPPANPYAEIPEGDIRGLSEEEVRTLLEGTGMRLALPAELNGYPGPKHALELADELALTDEQRAEVQALYDSTNAEARRVGREIVDLQTTLEAAFRDGSIDAARLEELGAKLGERWGELRLVHLRAHLDMMEILTPHQRTMYDQYRGYGQADHAAHEH